MLPKLNAIPSQSKNSNPIQSQGDCAVEAITPVSDLNKTPENEFWKPFEPLELSEEYDKG